MHLIVTDHGIETNREGVWRWRRRACFNRAISEAFCVVLLSQSSLDLTRSSQSRLFEKLPCADINTGRRPSKTVVNNFADLEVLNGPNFEQLLTHLPKESSLPTTAGSERR